MAKQPRSWWPARGETRASKRHDKVALGDEQVVGPYDEESCGRVVSKPAKAGTSGSRAPTARAKATDGAKSLERSTQEPAGVVGAERPHSPSLNRRDPSRPRRFWPQVAGLGCPGAAKPITGGPGKWWSAERKSEEAIAVAMIGGTTEPVVAKGL
jgi:hypothetical protein